MDFIKTKTIEDAVSVIGYGSWGISGQWNRTDESAAIRAIDTAIDSGINLFDTAPVYGLGQAEKLLGRALKGKRKKVFLASKAGLRFNGKGQVRNNLSRSSLFEEIDQILTRLQTDYIDLWQIHWPNDDYALEETLEAMVEIRKKGKVRHLGVCNFSLERLKQAETLAPIASWQGLYNLLEPNAERYHSINLEYRVTDELLPHLEDKGMLFLPYSPLMQGLLAGKWKPGDTPFDENDVRAGNPELQGERLQQHLKEVEQLRPLVEKYGISMVQLSLAWLTGQHASISVIAGARTSEQVSSNAAVGDFSKAGELFFEIQSLLGR